MSPTYGVGLGFRVLSVKRNPLSARIRGRVSVRVKGRVVGRVRVTVRFMTLPGINNECEDCLTFTIALTLVFQPPNSTSFP